jgi:hypothetical protein
LPVRQRVGKKSMEGRHEWLHAPRRFAPPWSIEEGGSLAPLLLAKHSPTMRLAHFIGDAGPR